jgi:DNA-binding transcriptional LysR family regulator
MSSVEERGLRRDHLLDDTVNCAILASGSDLARRTSLELHELSETPFLFPSRAFQPLLYDQMFALFEARGFTPRIEQTYDGMKTVWAMAAVGRGWCIGFESQRDDPPPGTVAVPVNGFAMPWGIDVLSREDESRTSILLVLDMLLDATQLNETQRTVA